MFNYQVADYMVGARNLVEAAGIAPGETVLILGDRRSDPISMDALEAMLTLHGCSTMRMITEPVSRYGNLPKPALEAMAASDVAIWAWPVFLTFSENYRAKLRLEREDHLAQGTEKRRPYFVYFEGTPGLLATDYARFPNALLWKIAAKVKDIVKRGTTVHLEGGHGTNLTAEYDANRLYGMQFGPGDPPGRCHFPWGRCGVYNGERTANGVVYLDCVQGVQGKLPEPMRWTVEDGRIVDVQGGGQMRDHCLDLFRAIPESQHLNEIMFGYHPKASLLRGVNDAMHWELISKMPWVGLGTPRKFEPFRHIDGAVLHTRLYIDDELLVDEDGRLSVLSDPEIVEAASLYGDPSQVLGAVSHAGHGSGAIW